VYLYLLMGLFHHYQTLLPVTQTEQQLQPVVVMLDLDQAAVLV
jgi:hypothetical protein